MARVPRRDRPRRTSAGGAGGASGTRSRIGRGDFDPPGDDKHERHDHTPTASDADDGRGAPRLTQLTQFKETTDWLLKHLPAMKYALGALALMAGIAITTRTFGLTARTALFGGVIGFAFTVVIFLFTKLTQLKRRDPGITWMARGMGIVVLLLFLAAAVFITSSAFFGWPLDLRDYLSAPRLQAMRREEDLRLIESVNGMAERQDYRGAWQRIDQRMGLGPLSKELRVARAMIAMGWTRNLSYIIGSRENFITLTTPLIPAMGEAIPDVDRRTQADLRAHIAWAGYLSNTESGPLEESPRPNFKEVFDLDPDNVFGHLFAATWMSRQDQVLNDIVVGANDATAAGRGREPELARVQADRHFALAVKSGRERPFVREWQLQSLDDFHSFDDALKKIVILNEMRLGGEPMPRGRNLDVDSVYYFHSIVAPEAQRLERVLPPSQHLETLRWSMDPEKFRRYLWVGRLYELTKDRSNALRIYLIAQEHLSLVQEVRWRRAAIKRCAENEQEVVRAIHELLQDPESQYGAFQGLLAFVSDRQAVARELVAVLRLPDLEKIYEGSLTAALTQYGVEVTPGLRDLLADSDAKIRRRSAYFAREAGLAAPCADKLIALISDPDPEVRSEGIDALSEAGEAGRRAVPLLIEMIQKEPDTSLRARAAGALKVGAPSDVAALHMLIALLREPAHYDQIEAFSCRALAAYGPAAREAAGDIAHIMVGTDDRIVLDAASDALRSIGAEAKDALPILVRAYSENDGDNRPVYARTILAVAAAAAQHGDASVLSTLEEACSAMAGGGKDQETVTALRNLLADIRARRMPATASERP